MQKERECKMCGEMFLPTGNAQQYCRRPECLKGRSADKKTGRDLHKGKWCIVCGRKIPELSKRKKTCGDACRQKAKRGFAPYRNCTSPPKLSLSDVQMQAQAKGMSYGKYVAMFES